MLMSVLVMSLNAKATFDADNKMLDESYYIAEYIQFNIFDLGPQQIELVSGPANQTIIEIRHIYDIVVDEDNVIQIEYLVTPIVDTLIFDTDTNEITYNGVRLNSSNVNITDLSTIDIIAIDALDCDPSIADTPCGQGIIELTLYIEVELSGGGVINPQKFVTTIII